MRTEQNIPQILSVNVNDSFHRHNISQQIINPAMYVYNVQNMNINQSIQSIQNDSANLHQNSSPQI